MGLPNWLVYASCGAAKGGGTGREVPEVQGFCGKTSNNMICSMYNVALYKLCVSDDNKFLSSRFGASLDPPFGT